MRLHSASRRGRGWHAIAGALVLMAQPAAAQPAADAAVIQVDQRVEARLRTAAVARAKLQRKVRVPATVELDPARVSRIDAGADGRILAVDIDTGQKVSAGQVLAWATSPDVTRAQVAMLGAVAEVDIQRRAVQRASELVQAEVIAQAELERRQKELFLAAMAVQSHRDQLALLGMSEREIEQVVRTESIHSEIAVVSEADGVLIERNVDRGQVVRTGEPVFVIADLSRVRVEGRAPEREVPFLARAREVRVEIPAVNQVGRIGDELFVGATVNPATRTVTVRTALDSPQGVIKPKMLATLEVSGPLEERLAVPASSVVRDGDTDYVFVREGEGRFRFAPVTLEREVDGLRAVAEGVNEGDVVVIDGAFRLNAERRRRLGQ
jgi:cobalt-zinc-cadmium efflux system membrane fusion protein